VPDKVLIPDEVNDKVDTAVAAKTPWATQIFPVILVICIAPDIAFEALPPLRINPAVDDATAGEIESCNLELVVTYPLVVTLPAPN
jgi:hypothetical protein